MDGRVVECVDGHRAVGLSPDHAWIRAHHGVRAIVPSLTDQDDDVETLEQMLIHGYERVRGGSWTDCAPLSPDERDAVRLAMFRNGHCARCGHRAPCIAATCNAPFADWLRALQDPVPVRYFHRCGRHNHSLHQCDETTHIRGLCLRCGRSGHDSDDCVEAMHVNGEFALDRQDTTESSEEEVLFSDDDYYDAVYSCDSDSD